MISEFESTPLIAARDAFIETLRNNQYIRDYLTDSKKGSEPQIGNRSIELNPRTRDYQIAVHHRCEEFPNTDLRDSHTEVKAYLYVDIFRKGNIKDLESIWSKINKFKHTVLQILHGDGDLTSNADISSFNWSGSRFIVDEDFLHDKGSNVDPDQLIEEIQFTLYYPMQLRLIQ